MSTSSALPHSRKTSCSNGGTKRVQRSHRTNGRDSAPTSALFDAVIPGGRHYVTTGSFGSRRQCSPPRHEATARPCKRFRLRFPTSTSLATWPTTGANEHKHSASCRRQYRDDDLVPSAPISILWVPWE